MRILSALLAISLALSPALADARDKGDKSSEAGASKDSRSQNADRSQSKSKKGEEPSYSYPTQEEIDAAKADAMADSYGEHAEPGEFGSETTSTDSTATATGEASVGVEVHRADGTVETIQ